MPRPSSTEAAGRVLDWMLLVVGTGLGVVSLTADLVGLGAFPGFGWKQTLGTVTAVVVVVLAASRIIRRDRRARS